MRKHGTFLLSVGRENVHWVRIKTILSNISIQGLRVEGERKRDGVPRGKNLNNVGETKRWPQLIRKRTRQGKTRKKGLKRTLLFQRGASGFWEILRRLGKAKGEGGGGGAEKRRPGLQLYHLTEGSTFTYRVWGLKEVEKNRNNLLSKLLRTERDSDDAPLGIKH